MEVDLASFLSPAGELLGEVSQRVLEFLSVRDLIAYVASSTSSPDDAVGDTADCVTKEEADASEKPRRQRHSPLSVARSWGDEARAGRERNCQGAAVGFALSLDDPEDEPTRQSRHKSSTGAGDEAGGGSRLPTPYFRRSEPSYQDDEEGDEKGRSGSGVRDGKGGGGSAPGQHDGEYSPRTGPCSSGSGGGVQLIALGEGHRFSEGELHGQTKQRSKKKISGTKTNPSILGVLIGLGLHPWAAMSALQGGVVHLLGGIPLLALLRWAGGRASAVLGMSFRVVLLPFDVTKGVVSYVMGSLEAMLNIATEIWCELRHLSLGELAVVISCVVTGNPLPDCLLNPLDYGGLHSGSSCDGYGGGNSRIFSRSSRETASLESGGGAGCLYTRGPNSGNSDADYGSGGAGRTRGTWQRAHAMRRRLDRVNHTASLVSYEERAESAVPRAKAQRVRRRMHYPMPLQCFQATVTVGGRHSAGTDSDTNGENGEDDGDDGRVSGEGGSSVFMCTPQSFPPTPVSRAHVMARTSQFSDDVLFLARDQLRLGENLKPGVDETTRATADFLQRQQRLAVLDGNNSCEGIVLTCGHHRATKVGPSLYSSARAMVPVLRNRHVYFQVSCVRDGPLAPSIGVGLSTPDMPLSTLVGAFSNSVGLCSTGQVLMSSRWYGEPGEYAMRKEYMSTVGVLVYLDGSRPFRSWDGDMVRALVSFSVDGRLVRVATGPGLTQAPPTAPPAAVVAGGAGGGVPPQHLQLQPPLVYGPPRPPELLSPLEALQPQPLQRSVSPATYTAAAFGGGPPQQQQDQQPPSGVGGSSASPWSPSVEETAPWEVAAASAAATAATAAAAGSGAHQIGRGRGAGVVHKAVGPGGGGAVLPAVAPPTVPETSAALGLALPKDRDLFPTITIHSPNTEVLCRFCAEDLLGVTRENMGAPPGVAIYALDGSLINVP